MRNRHKAFTLAEMLIVMGIIVIFLAMAVPAIRALTGSSSISVSRNELASLINRAREEAVAIQDVRGVMFIVDPASDRVIGVICQAAPVQDTSSSLMSSITMLDVLPGRDSLSLPPGIRLQMMFNGINSSPDDRYLGFNPLDSSSHSPPYVGGVILFDANGKLVARQYGFQMKNATNGQSNLCAMLTGMVSGMSSPPSFTGKISTGASSAYIPGDDPTKAPFSQLGLVIFDYETFKAQGFSDVDADINGQNYTNPSLNVGSVTQSQSEQSEENWIDANSTPVLINRFNGTLIKSE